MDGYKNVWGLYKQSKYKILEDFGTIDVQRYFLVFSSLKDLGAQILLKPPLARYLWPLQLSSKVWKDCISWLNRTWSAFDILFTCFSSE